MTRKLSKQGKIIIPDGVNIWPHEHKTAKSLIKYGHIVEFIRKSNRLRETSADCYIDGIKWEMKAPTADHLRTIKRNLKEGRWQSDRIVFDSRRMKRVPDKAIARELSKQLSEIAEIKRIKFVNRHGEVVDIK
ncbi:hypothetical protein FWD20_02235 [Candidatus Saccharibacteria bacterium]|nr:hypothetical protein [Candidatus Saccharibacteria bacterium]